MNRSYRNIFVEWVLLTVLNLYILDVISISYLQEVFPEMKRSIDPLDFGVTM